MESNKMTFYRYQPDANSFAGIGFSLDDDDRIVDVHFTDTPLADQWVAPVAHGFEDNPETEGEFPSLSNFNEIPVMSQRAWDVLRALIGYCCEGLPIIHPTGKPYFIIHVMETIDVLDEQRAEFSRNDTTGRISRIYKYAFKPELLHGKHIFKLPLESGGELIVDDDFRRAVEANGLVGLKFVKIYPPPPPEQDSSSPESDTSPVIPAPATEHYTETPLDSDVLQELEHYREMGRANLDLDEYDPDPSNQVRALDHFVDRWQQEEITPTGELYGDEKPDTDDVALCVGVLWGDQFVREFSWGWICLSETGRPDLFCVVSPDRAYVIYPTNFVRQLLGNPKQDNTLLLIFNMVGGGQLPPASPKAYLSLTDGCIRHIVPKP
jgi:hypothetical protein